MPKRLQRLLYVLVIAGLAASVYRHGLAFPLVFDDLQAIRDNPTIRRLWPLTAPLHPPDDSPLAVRPLVNLTFAVNYRVHGLDPVGYHVVNLALHVFCGLLITGVIWRAGAFIAQTDWGRRAAGFLAGVVAMLWLVHPLNTEAVQYLTQRTELLMAFFYLLTLYAAIRGFEAKAGRRGWFAASVLACFAGMGCKEVMVSAPLFVLLCDRTLVGGTFKQALKRHAGLYTGLAASWGLLVGLMLVQSRGRSAGMNLGVTPWQYLQAQAGVILMYLRMCFWPSTLTVAHGPPASVPLASSLPAGLCVLALLGVTAWGLRRGSWRGLAGAWFFMVLAPTSSVVPVVTEVAAERRMYLPLAAVVLLTVEAAGRALAPGRGRLREYTGLALLGLLLVVLGNASAARVGVYESDESLWADAVRKNPVSAMAAHNMAGALHDLGREKEALAEIDRALRLDPGDWTGHTLRGQVLAKLGRWGEAEAAFRESLALTPEQWEAHSQLGRLLADRGRLDPAIEAFRAAIAIYPQSAEVQNMLGASLFLRQRQRGGASGGAGAIEEAIRCYREAIRLDPGYAEPHENLGAAMAELDRPVEAIEEYRRAARLKPEFFEAHLSLARALVHVDKPEEAIAAYRQALVLQPGNAAAHSELGFVYARSGRMADAAGEFGEVVRLRPDDEEARRNLARAQAAGR